MPFNATARKPVQRVRYSAGGDVTAPTVTSASINAAGTELTLNFSETVVIGAGGSGGITITPSGGAATVTYSSGSGSTALVCTTSRTILQSETLTRSYVQPGNGIEDSAGIDLASFTTQPVTNNSTQTGSGATYTALKLASFEGGTPGNAASGANGFVTPESRTTFSTSVTGAFGSGTVCRTGFAAAGNQAFGGSLFEGTLPVVDGTELWVRTFEHFPTAWSFTDNGGGDAWGNYKWIRIWFASGGDNCFQTNTAGKMFGMTREGYGPTANMEYNLASMPVLPRDQFVCREYYILFHATAGTGKIRCWQDGTYLGEITGQTKASGDQSVNLIQFGNYWNGDAPGAQYMYLDEIIITTETPDATDAGGRPFIGTTRQVADF